MLKTCTTSVAMANLQPQEKNAHEVLIKVFRRGVVDDRELGFTWTLH